MKHQDAEFQLGVSSVTDLKEKLIKQESNILKNDTETSAEIDQTTDNVDMVGPGQLLSEAREIKGLTQAQVAEKLNFRKHLVKEIEADQFDHSLPAAFNRGYLKNYAKLVNISPEDVLASYEQLGVTQGQCSDMQSFSKITKKQAESNMLMWITYLIIVILATATVVWWYQAPSMKPTPAVIHEETENNDVQGTVESSLHNENASIEEQNVEPSSQSLTANSGESASESAVENTAEDATEIVVNVLENSTENDITDTAMPLNSELSNNPGVEDVSDINDNNSQTLNNNAVSDDSETDVLSSNVDSANEESSVTEGQAVTNIAETSASSGEESTLAAPVHVVFTFAGDCWVNITDGAGERVAWGMKKSGYVMNISGQAPFNITLGRPELVQIDYNDVAIDMSKFNAGNIAKFSLPQKP